MQAFSHFEPLSFQETAAGSGKFMKYGLYSCRGTCQVLCCFLCHLLVLFKIFTSLLMHCYLSAASLATMAQEVHCCLTPCFSLLFVSFTFLHFLRSGLREASIGIVLLTVSLFFMSDFYIFLLCFRF